MKARPQLVRDPGWLPGICSSIGGTHECGDIDISGQACCKRQILTVVLFSPWRWAHARSLINATGRLIVHRPLLLANSKMRAHMAFVFS